MSFNNLNEQLNKLYNDLSSEEKENELMKLERENNEIFESFEVDNPENKKLTCFQKSSNYKTCQEFS